MVQQKNQVYGGIPIHHLLKTLDHESEGIVGLNQVGISMQF
jgi:hypothetical protein